MGCLTKNRITERIICPNAAELILLSIPYDTSNISDHKLYYLRVACESRKKNLVADNQLKLILLSTQLILLSIPVIYLYIILLIASYKISKPIRKQYSIST